jgi:hypothetical protein
MAGRDCGRVDHVSFRGSYFLQRDGDGPEERLKRVEVAGGSASAAAGAAGWRIGCESRDGRQPPR